MFKWWLKFILIGLLGTTILWSDDSIDQDLQKQYHKIASSFITYHANQNFAKWQNTKIIKMTPFYSVDDHLIAYEASIANTLDPTQKRGYLFINVQDNMPLINTFSFTGKSISEILQEFWDNQYADLVKSENLEVIDFKFLLSSPSGYAIGVKLNGDAPFLENANLQNGYYVFSPFPESKKLDYTLKTVKKSRALSSQQQERENFKHALLNKDFSGKLFHLKEKGEIKRKKQLRDTQTISGSFAPLYQEKRYWNNDDIASYAGCAPIAWSILYEYWDERGYGNLVGSNSDNVHYYPQDEDIRYMVSKLRKYMYASIDPVTLETGVKGFNFPKGIQYAHERGYTNFQAYNITDETRWSALKQTINRNLPAIVGYQRPELHAAVVFQYIDYSGTANDYFCVRAGGEQVITECRHISYLDLITIVNVQKNDTKQTQNSIKYGAVAISTANNILTIGAKWNTTSKEYAIQKAIQYCQSKTSTGCRLLKVVENSCFGIAQIPYQARGSYALGTTRDKAQQNAINYCNKSHNRDDCFIRLAFCSYKNGYTAHKAPSKTQDPQPPKLHVDPPTTNHNEYAAIAIAVRNGTLIGWGRSWHKSSRDAAKKAALKACAKSTCKVIVTAKNQCVSLAKIRYKDKGNFYKDNNPYTAKYKALSKCKNRKDGECFTVTTVCSNGNH